MKVTIPEALKADVPHNTWGKMLSATPVIMTVIATMLAGLASSEMTQAQYERAFAAQMQSKAADQWSLFQAKRLRGTMQSSTLEILSSLHPTTYLQRAELEQFLRSLPADNPYGGEWLSSEEGKLALDAVERAEIPHGRWDERVPAGLERAYRASESFNEEALAAAVAALQREDIEEGLRDVHSRIDVLDALTKRIGNAISGIEKQATQANAPEGIVLGLKNARYRFNVTRYEAEARLNQSVATLLEFKVRQSNVSAERHHVRSIRFFYGMLAAQLAVIVSTLAMAAKERSWLWGVSAAAGFIALTIAVYVYLYV